MASACTSVLAHIEWFNFNLIKHHSSCLAGVSGLSLLSALNFHASDFISVSYAEIKWRVKVWGCRFHLVTVFWAAAGTDPRVLLPSWDVCQRQQLQSGGDGGRHSRLWRGAATLGQEPGGVCAHQSSGKEQALLTLPFFCCYGWSILYIFKTQTLICCCCWVFFWFPLPVRYQLHKPEPLARVLLAPLFFPGNADSKRQCYFLMVSQFFLLLEPLAPLRPHCCVGKVIQHHLNFRPHAPPTLSTPPPSPCFPFVHQHIWCTLVHVRICVCVRACIYSRSRAQKFCGILFLNAPLPACLAAKYSYSVYTLSDVRLTVSLCFYYVGDNFLFFLSLIRMHTKCPVVHTRSLCWQTTETAWIT